MSIPYFAFYPKDWLADTGHLTYEERGVYFDLLCHMWVRADESCTLPDDDRFLASLLRLPLGKWRKLRESLIGGVAPVLSIADGQVTNKRLAQEFAIAKQKSDKAAQSARIRWQPNEPPPSGLPMHSERNANASPNEHANALPTDMRTQCYPDKDKELETESTIPPTPQTGSQPEPEPASAGETTPSKPNKQRSARNKPPSVPGWGYPLLWQLITEQQGYVPDWNYAAQTDAVNRILAKHPNEQPGDLARFLAYKATCYRADPHSQPTFTAYEADYAGWVRAGKPRQHTKGDPSHERSRYESPAERRERETFESIASIGSLGRDQGGYRQEPPALPDGAIDARVIDLDRRRVGGNVGRDPDRLARPGLSDGPQWAAR